MRERRALWFESRAAASGWRSATTGVDGIDPVVVQRRVREGHLGLRLLHDLVSEAGGRLEVERAPNGGTVLALDLHGRPLASPLR